MICDNCAKDFFCKKQKLGYGSCPNYIKVGRDILDQELARAVSIGDGKGSYKWVDFSYEKVILSGPATIVIWKDGTKTVVKQQEGDDYSIEKAIAMCIAKKALGNKGNYYNTILKMSSDAEPRDCLGRNGDGK